jgi:vacuolar-type H+-ATPase subunit I/STV1
MAKTQFSVDQLKAEAVKPLYAVAGATEVAYELARGYAAEAQKTAAERFSDAQTAVSKIERDPKALQNQAVTLVNTRVDELTKDAKDAQSKFEARIAELQKDAKAFPAKFQAQIDEAVAELTKTYESLADRGEKLVAAIRKDGVKAVAAVRKAPKKSSVARRQAAKKGAATNAPASKAAAEKAPGNKSKPAAKKAVAQGGAKGGTTTAKKVPAQKAATTTSSTQASA